MTTSSRSKPHFAIIGCGIAGPCVATLLAEQGYTVTLFEQARELTPVGAGVMLQPLGQLVLHRMGLLEEVIQNAEPIHELHAIQRSGKTLIRMPFSAARVSMHAYGVHRHDIFQAMVDRMRSSGVQLVLDANIESTHPTSDGVELTDTEHRRWKGFHHVIISNGARTRFRNTHHFREKGYTYNHGAIWFNAQSSEVRGRLLQVVQGAHRLMGMLPVGKERLSLFWGIPCRDAQKCMSGSIDDWKDEVRQFYPPVEPILESITSWEQARYGTYQNSVISKSFDSHHLFLGDSAHAMSPHLGQGLNLALLDAYRFAISFQTHGHWDAACRHFVNQQRSQLRYYRFVTGMLAPFFQSDHAWRGWFRDLVLPWFHRVPMIRGQMALTMTGLKSGFLAGKIRL